MLFYGKKVLLVKKNCWEIAKRLNSKNYWLSAYANHTGGGGGFSGNCNGSPLFPPPLFSAKVESPEFCKSKFVGINTIAKKRKTHRQIEIFSFSPLFNLLISPQTFVCYLAKLMPFLLISI